eukprot:CAMPEP_0206438910 /NCGR_PEP_ID=MMETSP0324_2-20121206/11910_1 /ASSEMBLY_ACC=CAM_ASM_000836 /TAXON_ID=2866 /ORGANISM="Crypthecodinium cohnii, Strain Seligo" /LENGTH=226 /DNA_ID=CAMNT_0053906457 /DNA_START=101 /DNA_END=776 /DNA_ORIENTATION=+
MSSMVGAGEQLLDEGPHLVLPSFQISELPGAAEILQRPSYLVLPSSDLSSEVLQLSPATDVLSASSSARILLRGLARTTSPPSAQPGPLAEGPRGAGHCTGPQLVGRGWFQAGCSETSASVFEPQNIAPEDCEQHGQCLTPPDRVLQRQLRWCCSLLSSSWPTILSSKIGSGPYCPTVGEPDCATPETRPAAWSAAPSSAPASPQTAPAPRLNMQPAADGQRSGSS